MCRIPSQAKQSGMPFKVVGFIKKELYSQYITEITS
jgi:hypothetical protein